MEDDLKILQVEYLSNHLLDIAQILNLSLDDQTSLYMVQIHTNSLNKEKLQWKMTSNGGRLFNLSLQAFIICLIGMALRY